MRDKESSQIKYGQPVQGYSLKLENKREKSSMDYMPRVMKKREKTFREMLPKRYICPV